MVEKWERHWHYLSLSIVRRFANDSFCTRICPLCAAAPLLCGGPYSNHHSIWGRLRHLHIASYTNLELSGNSVTKIVIGRHLAYTRPRSPFKPFISRWRLGCDRSGDTSGFFRITSDAIAEACWLVDSFVRHSSWATSSRYPAKVAVTVSRHTEVYTSESPPDQPVTTATSSIFAPLCLTVQ